MKKGFRGIAALLTASMTVAMLAGCGNNSAQTDAPAAETQAAETVGETAGETAEAGVSSGDEIEVTYDGDVIRLEIAHCNSEEDAMGVAANYFEQRVEELSNGKIDVVIYPNATICAASEEMTTILNGGIDGDFAIAAVAESVNTLEGILSIPFLVYANDLETARELSYRITNDEVIEGLIEEQAASAGFKRLGDPQNSVGGVLFENNVRPVETVADAQGLRIRTAGGSSIDRLMSEFGCTAVTIAGNELSMALSQGVADGVCSGVEWIDSVNSTCDYLTMPCIYDFTNPVYISLNWWNDLPEDLQAVMEKAMDDTEVYIYDYAISNFNSILEKIESEGTTVSYLNLDDPDTAAAAASLLRSGIEEKVASGGDAAQQIIDRIFEIKEEMGIESIEY